jgi:hypothetical protein
MTDHICPLCQSKECVNLINQPNNIYHLCEDCFLISADTGILPTPKHEFDIYNQEPVAKLKLEENEWLSTLMAQLEAQAAQKGKLLGLDYGCGKQANLANALQRAGWEIELYDPYFFPDADFTLHYDFIICKDTITHFHDPHSDFERLYHLLDKGGILILMTSFWKELEKVKTHLPHIDKTQTCFYHEKTIHHIASMFDWKLMEENKEFRVLQRN